MPTFQEVGFLGDELAEYRANVRATEEASFRIADLANSVAMKILWELPKQAESAEQKYFVACYARATQHFQCLLLLHERGAEADARALLRALAETVFLAAGMFKAKGMVTRLEADNAVHRKLMAERMRAMLLERDAAADVSRFDAVLAEIAAEFPRESLSRIRWDKLAQEVDMPLLWEAAYRFTSGDAAHATLGAFNRHFAADDQGEHVGYDFRPTAKDVRRTFRPAVVAMIDLMKLAIEHVGQKAFEADVSYIVLEAQFFKDHW